MTTTFEQLLQRARELGAAVGQAAVDSGDHARFIEDGDDTDELRCNLWTGSPDGERRVKSAIAGLSAAARDELPPDDALWDQLYDAWHTAYDERVHQLVDAR